MEFPAISWNFQQFLLNFPKKLFAILLDSISESSFPKLLSNDVVIPFPLFSLQKVYLASFFNFPKSLSHFGKRLAQVTF